jgi:hypothetical protein
MKYKPICALVSALAITILAFPVAAQNEKTAEIIRRTDVAEGYHSVYMDFDQIITTSSGAKRTLKIRAWAVENGDRQLAEYLAPADIKGQRILMTEDGDNIWMFNAETRRIRRLGSHMKKKKVMGSDFTFEDQAGGKVSEKYTGVLIGEATEGGSECWVLDLTPTPKGPSYSRVRAWIAKEDYVTRRVDYYQNDQKQPFKRLISSDMRKVKYQRDGATMVKITPYRMVMTNLEDRTETTNIVEDIRFGVKIPGSIFNPRKLDF